MRLSSIFLSLSVLKYYHLSSAADLDDFTGLDRHFCQNGSLLTNGDKRYADIFPNDMVNTLPFLQTTNVNGMYCDCNSGHTGIDCATPFEICQDNSICFHGAPCVQTFSSDTNPTAEKYHCACPRTTYPVNTSFEGKSCEYEVTSYCDQLSGPFTKQFELVDVSASGKWYCTNGADCRTGVVRPSEKCECTDNFYGLHCEFTEEPVCELDCFNNGVCKNGVKDYATLSNSLQEHFEPDTEHDTHCLCLSGFTGRYCENDISSCGSKNCLNGGVCFDDSVCDCSDAITNVGDGEVLTFAGSSCESVVTSFCDAPSGFDPMSFFCTNDGKCAEDHWEACECGPDYTGPRCEFTVQNGQQNVCDLQCQNGGTCFFGNVPFSSKADIVVESNSVYLEQSSHTNENDEMHCKCPDGYSGILCDINICGDYEHFCLNTGACLRSNDSYTCDCAGNTTDSVFAGLNCNYAATTFCGGPGASLDSFCTNQGTCKSQVGVVGNHPGCECTNEFTGDFCEIFTRGSSEDSSRDITKSKVFWYVLVSISALLIYGGLLVSIRRSRIRKKREQTPIESGQNIDTDVDIDGNMKSSEIYETGQYNDFHNVDDEYVMQTVEIT